MECPKCKTEFGYFRLETNEWVCRKCGKISKFRLNEKVKPSKEIVIKIEKKVK